MEENEQIILAEFIEDLCPKYILMLINNTVEKKTTFHVKQLSKIFEHFEGESSDTDAIPIDELFSQPSVPEEFNSQSQ